jgi:hypothetical protein
MQLLECEFIKNTILRGIIENIRMNKMGSMQKVIAILTTNGFEELL